MENILWEILYFSTSLMYEDKVMLPFLRVIVSLTVSEPENIEHKLKPRHLIVCAPAVPKKRCGPNIQIEAVQETAT